jgi:DNA replication and repair protein RecF
MITNLRLQRFRSYEDASFEFEAGVNVIVGPNASGKTNLLEAVLMVARGRSYRASDAELIQFQQPWARLDANLAKEHRAVKITLDEVGRTSKQYEIDGKTFARLSPKHALPVVIFEPNHLALLGGSPELRRAFIDELSAQVNPAYDAALRHYKRAVQQRNRLLKTGAASAQPQLFAWDVRLSELGAQLVATRHEVIDRLNQQLSPTYSTLAGQTSELVITYSNSVPAEGYASYLLKQLETQAELDLLRGFTGAGPHREDLLFHLQGQPLSSTASRGENRTALLSLKILELAIIEEKSGRKPLLLLDDVFSELDGARRKALANAMQAYRTFITTTDADVVMKQFLEECRIIALA